MSELHDRLIERSKQARLERIATLPSEDGFDARLASIERAIQAGFWHFSQIEQEHMAAAVIELRRLKTALAEVHSELKDAVASLDVSSALVRQYVHAAHDRAALAQAGEGHE